MSRNQQKICIDDTIETLIYQKQALQIKLKHNIAQLSNKNVYLTTILKQLCTKEKQLISDDCSTLKQIIGTCRQLEDDLQAIDILEKKSQILKAQVLAMSYRFAEESDKSKIKKSKDKKQSNNEEIKENKQSTHAVIQIQDNQDQQQTEK